MLCFQHTTGGLCCCAPTQRSLTLTLSHTAPAQVYIYLGVESIDVLLKRVHEEVMSNPPLGYEPQEAATRFFDKAKAEVAASRQEVSGRPAHMWRALLANKSKVVGRR